MSNFKFSSNIVTLDIEGKVFDVEMNSEFTAKMKRYAKESGERAKKIIESREGGTGEVIRFLTGIIDALIGNGASEQIFRERKYDIYDLCDVLVYICDEYDAFQRARIERYNRYLGEDV